MLIKRLKDCAEITAGDQTRLRELLHPDRDPAKIRYSLAVAWLAIGARSRAHKLKTSEVYYLFRGTGVMHIGEEVALVTAGDAVYIPPGSVQWLQIPARRKSSSSASLTRPGGRKTKKPFRKTPGPTFAGPGLRFSRINQLNPSTIQLCLFRRRPSSPVGVDRKS
jgi:mannose-6-phosphate isomerase-like protein (cupin superfamily)